MYAQLFKFEPVDAYYAYKKHECGGRSIEGSCQVTQPINYKIGLKIAKNKISDTRH